MASAAHKKTVTPEEYLAAERRSEIKHEYDRGFIIAMAGASRWHNVITSSLNREICTQLKGRTCETYANEMRIHLKGRPCEAFVSDMRILVADTGLYTYPDLVIACGEPRFLDAETDTLINPVAIVEVLSPSTEAYDRGKKFAHYRRIPSLVEFVLVAQDRPLIERFTRRGDEWALATFEGLDATLALESAGVRVPLREIYDRVDFAAAEGDAG